MEILLSNWKCIRAMCPIMGTFQRIRDKFQGMIGEGKPFRTINHMATETGIEQKSLERFLKGGGGLTLKSTAKAFDLIGVQIIFPDEELTQSSLSTPEAARVDELIQGMRKMKMSREAIREAVVTELASMFEKDTRDTKPEERKRAS